jgi:hypothetical protein
MARPGVQPGRSRDRKNVLVQGSAMRTRADFVTALAIVTVLLLALALA